MGQLTLREGNEMKKVSKDITNTNTADHSAITSDSLRHSHLNALRFNNALSRLIPLAGRSGYKRLQVFSISRSGIGRGIWLR